MTTVEYKTVQSLLGDNSLCDAFLGDGFGSYHCLYPFLGGVSTIAFPLHTSFLDIIIIIVYTFRVTPSSATSVRTIVFQDFSIPMPLVNCVASNWHTENHLSNTMNSITVSINFVGRGDAGLYN